MVKHGAGPSFEIIFLDVTSRGKGWAHPGVTLTVDPPGLAWTVTRSGIPGGALLFPLTGPCPQGACRDEVSVEAGSPVPGEGNTHISGQGWGTW